MVGGAKYTEDLKRFHQLQDEYLLIVNNDIKSVVDLVDFISEQEEKIQQIEDRQHEIYRESSSRKRSIKNEEQYREYQIWHVEVQEELDELKQEKREIKRQIQLADDIIKEDLADETGLKEELCELVAGIIKENYQTLQMGLIMSYLRKKFDEDKEGRNGKDEN